MRPLVYLTFVLLLLTGTAAAAESLVVIAASGTAKQFAPGAVFRSDAIIDLPAGGRITLLSESGGTVRLQGPYSGSVRPAENGEPEDGSKQWSSAFTEIAGLLTKEPEQTTVISAARDIDSTTDAGQPDVWLMAVDGSGHRCVQAANVWMWRRKSEARMEFALRSQSARRTDLVWDAGKDRMKLPREFVRDSTLIVMKSGKPPRRFQMHVLPKSIAAGRLGAVLLWMADSGCSRQARLLIDALGAETPVAR